MDDSFKLKFHLLDGKGKPCGVFDDAILRYIKEHLLRPIKPVRGKTQKEEPFLRWKLQRW